MATEPTQTQNSVVYDNGQRVGVAVSVFTTLPLGTELKYGPVRCYLWPLFPSRSLVYPSGKSYFSLCLRTAYEPLLVQTTPKKNFQEHTHVWLFHVPAIIQYPAGFRCCDEFWLAGNWPSGCGSILHGSRSIDTIRESRDGDVVCFFYLSTSECTTNIALTGLSLSRYTSSMSSFCTCDQTKPCSSAHWGPSGRLCL